MICLIPARAITLHVKKDEMWGLEDRRGREGEKKEETGEMKNDELPVDKQVECVETGGEATTTSERVELH